MSIEITTESVPEELVTEDHSRFSLIQRKAKAMSLSTIVPAHYQGEKGFANCIVAMNMAERLDADPLMVMQNLYIVHGNPAWSAQFLIACFNQTGRFTPIRYREVGEEGTDSWGRVAYAKEIETGDIVESEPITIKLAKAEGWYQKRGSKWQTMPGQMLRYRAAAWLVRTIAPEIAMGLQTADEINDINANSQSNAQPTVVQKLADIQAEAEPAEEQDSFDVENSDGYDPVPTAEDLQDNGSLEEFAPPSDEEQRRAFGD